jgi:hypothetical protein
VHWSPIPPYNFSYLTSSRITYANIMNGGSHLAVTNALVVDANVSWTNPIAGMDDACFAGWCAPNGTRLAGMRAMAWDTGVYAAAYPALAALQAGCDSGPEACGRDPSCPAAPWGGAFAATANVNVSTVTTTGRGNATRWDPAGFNFTGQFVVAASEGAGFVAADPRGSLNFQLRDDSPVYAALPGFTRIPMECFGPWACADVPTPYPRAATIPVPAVDWAWARGVGGGA